MCASVVYPRSEMSEFAPIVTTEQGQLKGKISVDFKGNSFYSFLGIPYAKPPIGDLRFKAPQFPESWSGIRDAIKNGPESPSEHIVFHNVIGSEEHCLNLNVYTKELSNDPSKRKPVMFWIHGGAFSSGSNKTELFGPDYLMSEDIVLIVINYRLGILGFLSCEDPSLGVPGNAGLKDVVMALKWAQKNISNFGGDPNNVTIFGESAGSAICHYLLLSPLTEGLFHKAILQSGCSLNCWAQGICNIGIAASCMGYKETNEKEILRKLQNESSRNIVVGQHRPYDPFQPDRARPFGPVVEKQSNEDAFLTEDPLTLLKEGRFRKVPIIMGYNNGEGFLWEIFRRTKPNLHITKDFETEIPFNVNIKKGTDRSKEVSEKIKKYFFGDENATEENIEKLYLMKGDNQFIYGIHQAFDYHRLHATDPLYFYVMTLDGPLNNYKKLAFTKYMKTRLFLNILILKLQNYTTLKGFLEKLEDMIPTKPFVGACHADDVGYLFSNFLSLDIIPDSFHDVCIQRFVKLWTNFARYGNPTPEDITIPPVLSNIKWTPVSKNEFNFLEIGEQLRIRLDPDIERIQFWKDIFN